MKKRWKWKKRLEERAARRGSETLAPVNGTPDAPEYTYVIEFDGSCNPNPGGATGYGWRLTHSALGTQVATDSGRAIVSPRTCNTAEWYALIKALTYVAEQIRGPVGRVIIRGDSQLILKQLTGRYGCHKPYLAELRKQAVMLLRSIGCAYETEWIPRHLNAEADALSRQF